MEYENLHGWRITCTYIRAHLTYLEEDPYTGVAGGRGGYLGTLILRRYPQGNSNIQLFLKISQPSNSGRETGYQFVLNHESNTGLHSLPTLY